MKEEIDDGVVVISLCPMAVLHADTFIFVTLKDGKLVAVERDGAVSLRTSGTTMPAESILHSGLSLAPCDLYCISPGCNALQVRVGASIESYFGGTFKGRTADDEGFIFQSTAILTPGTTYCRIYVTFICARRRCHRGADDALTDFIPTHEATPPSRRDTYCGHCLQWFTVLGVTTADKIPCEDACGLAWYCSTEHRIAGREVHDRVQANAKEMDAKRKTCGACGRRNAGLMACRGCKAAHYCDRQCQLDDWQRHKADCKTVKK